MFGFRHIGPQGREVPSRTFFDLSSWHLINWLYAPKAIRQVQELRTNYLDTRLHDRLDEGACGTPWTSHRQRGRGGQDPHFA